MAKNEQEKPGAEETAPVKMVSIKILRDCEVGGKVRLPGTVVEATEDEAKELCDRGIPGYHPFYGTMPEIGPLMDGAANPLERKKLYRAVRVA